MKTSDILEVIREQASEDWYGLYEIIWSLNARYPDIPGAQKVAASIPILESLLASGEIVLVRSRWATDIRDPVNREEAVMLVRDPAAWVTPSDKDGGEYLSFGAA